MGPDLLYCWNRTKTDSRGKYTERNFLIGPGIHLLVDQLLHRAFYFSKNLYEKSMDEEARAAFARVTIHDHTELWSRGEFLDSWLNHVTYRAAHGMPVAYGVRAAALPENRAARVSDKHRATSALQAMYEDGEGKRLFSSEL